MKYIFTSLIVSFICVAHSFGQQFDHEKSFAELKRLRLQILIDSVVGKKYYYDFTKDPTCNKTALEYLGNIKTDNNEIYKVMTCFYVHGQSCRGTSSIVIYNVNNKYIGSYYVGMPYELPDIIRNGDLIYSRINKECKFKKDIKISFQQGLPDTIFIPCDAINSGNTYSFSDSE